MLESALAAGLASEGAGVELLGIAPTPALAWLCTELGVPGAMISASHNPFADNGIKLFAAGGRKLTDDTEADLLVALAELDPGDPSGPTGRDLGTIRTADFGARLVDRRTGGQSRGATARRARRSCSTGPTGANAHVAPDVLRSLGAEVHAVGRRTRRRQHQRRVRVDQSRDLRRGGGRGRRRRGPGVRRRRRSRRRRRPSGSGRRRRPHDGAAGHRSSSTRHAGRRHRRGDRDDQSRVPPRHGGGGDQRRADPGGRPVRAGGARTRRGASVASSRATSS